MVDNIEYQNHQYLFFLRIITETFVVVLANIFGGIITTESKIFSLIIFVLIVFSIFPFAVRKPLGTTIAALRHLEKAGLRSSLIEAVVVAAEQSRKMG